MSYNNGNIELTDEDKEYIKKFEKRGQVLTLPITRQKLILIRNCVNDWENQSTEALKKTNFPTIESHLQTENDALQKEVNEVREELDVAKKKIETLTKAYEISMRENIDLNKRPSLESVNELRNKYEVLLTKIENNDESKAKIESLTMNNKELLVKVEKLKRPFLNSTQNEELYNENQKNIEEIQYLKSKLNDNFLEIQDLKKSVKEKSFEIKRLESKIKSDIKKRTRIEMLDDPESVSHESSTGNYRDLDHPEDDIETSFKDDPSRINPHV